MAKPSTAHHTWKFFRSGGLDQVRLETSDDLLALAELDQKLWVALSCPVKGLELDEKTLALVDTDADGHIRAPELIAAVQWAATRLKDPGDLLRGSDLLPLASISDSAPEGRELAASARKILAALGRPDATLISVDDAADLAVQASISQVALLGAATAGALDVLKAVRPKIDDYFARCRLAAFDPRSIEALNRSDADYSLIASKELKGTAEEVAGFPLARIGAGLSLPLSQDVNPAWAAALTAFRDRVAIPILGGSRIELAESEWTKIQSAFEPYETWIVKRTAADIERLARYHRDLRALLHNFVNFADFYSRTHWAIFQAGSLYLDARRCDLCLRADGPNPLAAMSKACIAYCQCTRSGCAPMIIAACFTQGDSDYLFPGRHGIFYDRKGQDWDAVITSLADNPIAIREAVFSPYKKFVRLIEDQVAKRAAAADAASGATVFNAAATATGPGAPAPAASKKLDIGTVAALGIAAGAIGTFFTTLAAYATHVLSGGAWMIVAALVGVLLVISGPSVLIAWLKLRQRTLGPILDANGWAINGRVKINLPLGEALTHRAVLPPGSQRLIEDPYEDKAAKRRRRQLTALFILAIVAIGAWSLRHTGVFTWLRAHLGF